MKSIEVLEEVDIELDDSTNDKRSYRESMEKSIEEENKPETEESEEKEYKKLQRLYRQETGKRPIYRRRETIGFSQWLEHQKLKTKKLEKKEEKKQEEERWKRILRQWIEESKEEVLSSEVKLVLKEIIQMSEILEKLFRKFVMGNLTETERDKWISNLKKYLNKYPIHLYLYQNIYGFKVYVQESHPWDINRIKNRFLRHLARKYEILKQEILELEELINTKENLKLKDGESIISQIQHTALEIKTAINIRNLWILDDFANALRQLKELPEIKKYNLAENEAPSAKQLIESGHGNIYDKIARLKRQGKIKFDYEDVCKKIGKKFTYSRKDIIVPMKKTSELDYNKEELVQLSRLKEIYMKENNINKLSDKKFSEIIGIRISDIKTKKLRFTTPRFVRLMDFAKSLKDGKKLAIYNIKNLIKMRLSLEIPSDKKDDAEYIFARDLMELYRDVNLYIVMKRFCKVIEYDLWSCLRNNNRINDNSLRKIRQRLSELFNEEQNSFMNKLIQTYKKNRRKLDIKEFDKNYMIELTKKIEFLLRNLDISKKFDIIELKKKSIAYFIEAVNNGLTYQLISPNSHSGYVAPALVYFVLIANGIYYIEGDHINTQRIAKYSTNYLKVLGLTKRTVRDIPIGKIYNFFSESIQDEIGLKDRKNYTLNDFINEFNLIRAELGYIDDTFPEGRELERIKGKYSSFFRATFRYAGGYDNVVKSAGFIPARKQYLKYNDYEVEDFVNKIIDISNKLDYDEGVCPSWKEIEGFDSSFIYVFRKKGLRLGDLASFGLIPKDLDLSFYVGKLVHYIFECKFLEYIFLKKGITGYFEIRPSKYCEDFSLRRVDNASINDKTFFNQIYSKQRIVKFSNNIILISFDYTLSSEEEIIYDKCNRGYQGKNKFLIIISLFAKKDNLLNELNVPFKENIIHVNFDQFCRFMSLPINLINYLRSIINLARDVFYSDKGFESKYFYKLDNEAFKAKEKLEELFQKCSHEALEKDLTNILNHSDKVKDLLT